MHRLFAPAALGLLVYFSSQSPAQEPVREPKPEPLPVPKAVELPPPCASGCQVEKTISIPKPLLVEEQTAIAVPKLRLREQVVGRDHIQKLELTWKEEKHVITEMKAVPRTVEQQVCTTKVVPKTTTDPATGKPCTVYETVEEVKTVKVQVFDMVPVQKEVIVRMPCVKPVDQEVEIRKLVVDETKEAAILKRWSLILTPNEIKVLLPACPLPLPFGH
jgi:hypothetical protein